MHFLQQLIQPHAVAMFAFAVLFLFGYAYPGFRTRDTGGFVWLLYLLVGVLAAIAWILLIIT